MHCAYIAAIMSGIALFASCSQKGAVVTKLETQADSLRLINSMQQEALDDLTAYVAQLSNALDSITIYEGILTIRVDEKGRALGRKKVLDNLARLENILARKRSEIEQLDSMLNARDDQVRNLSTLVQHLFSELDVKEETIQNLRAEVNAKNVAIRNLTGRVDSLTSDIADLSDTLKNVKERSAIEVSTLREESQSLRAESQRVFYVIGTSKELQELGVLSKKFMQKSKVDTGEFDLSKFIEANLFELTEIQIVGKNPKIMSMEPPSTSYVLDGSNTGKGSYTLSILHPEQFWNATKYLVIRVTQ